MTSVEKDILKEFNRQKIKSDEIAIIMSKLDNNDKKHKFLSFLIDNRNVLLTFTEMIKVIEI